MATDKEYNRISKDVYRVDSGKVDNPIKQGDTVAGGQFQVLKVKDNTDNGMQVIAVAPVDKNGEADYSEVVIAYAKTNREDFKDLGTDIQSIGLGSDELKFFNVTADSQFSTALDFAKQVEKEVKRKNPNVVMTTTGHSLGQSLAMYVELKQGYANVGYNGPDIHKMISDKEIKYMQEHPEQFRNYRNKHDDIGNVMGNVTKTAIYPKVTKARYEVKSLCYTIRQ
ncbi:hypothetical protein [Streptococcus pluranimalium]|uniref:hypothetical protein n=1 Tax=Streptococcus pluranimalium TaxID=82348 RepID=UPI0039FCEEBB